MQLRLAAGLVGLLQQQQLFPPPPGVHLKNGETEAPQEDRSSLALALAGLGRNSWRWVKGLPLQPRSMHQQILFPSDCSQGTLRLGSGSLAVWALGCSSSRGGGSCCLWWGGEDSGSHISSTLATDDPRLLQCVCVEGEGGPCAPPGSRASLTPIPRPGFRCPGSAAANGKGRGRRQHREALNPPRLDPPSCSLQAVKRTQYLITVYLGAATCQA